MNRWTMLAVRLGCLAAAALLIVAPLAYSMVTVLTSVPCLYDPLHRWSEIAAMAASWLGAAVLLWAAWRPRLPTIAAGIVIPLAALLFHLVVAERFRPRELACRARSLPQALAACGERIGRYGATRSGDVLDLRLRPGAAADGRYLCLATWAEWKNGVAVYPR